MHRIAPTSPNKGLSLVLHGHRRLRPLLSRERKEKSSRWCFSRIPLRLLQLLLILSCFTNSEWLAAFAVCNHIIEIKRKTDQLWIYREYHK
uniref:Uncharacterized protein n=1 Tax=Noccaea caerulescens TaxID=107243 RepID=A0A1J3D5F4_NOCCA